MNLGTMPNGVLSVALCQTEFTSLPGCVSTALLQVFCIFRSVKSNSKTGSRLGAPKKCTREDTQGSFCPFQRLADAPWRGPAPP